MSKCENLFMFMCKIRMFLQKPSQHRAVHAGPRAFPYLFPRPRLPGSEFNVSGYQLIPTYGIKTKDKIHLITWCFISLCIVSKPL